VTICGRRKGVPTQGQSLDRGAAAVEFALVMPVLFLLLFGIIDYGIWFSESLAVRQGVRESARQAVVQTFDSTCTAGTDIQKVVCGAKKQIQPFSGVAYAWVVVPSAGWKKGEPLTVCAVVKPDALTGFLPMPDAIRSKIRMSIEVATPPPTGATPGGAGDTDPTGSNWSWCS
jgi:hypothetical protein